MAQTRVDLLEKLCGTEEDYSDGLYSLLDTGKDELNEMASYCAQNKVMQKVLLKVKIKRPELPDYIISKKN